MNILLTNDDGYDAPWLVDTFKALQKLGRVQVVAPRVECSACSHAITLRRDIAVEQRTHEVFGRSFAVSGTPADCVRLAIFDLVEGDIDLVVSGMNGGANTGVDTYYSGTVAAAREAAFMGLPAIALSQAMRKEVDVDWDVSARIACDIAAELAREPHTNGSFWNVNLSAPPPEDPMNHIQRVPIATHATPLSFDRSEDEQGNVSFRYGAPYWSREAEGNTDYTVVRDGGIAVTAISLF